MNGPSQLRKLLVRSEIIVAPGAFDGISGRLVEAAGFPAIYITGAGVASSRLGCPDIGLITMNEILETARNIVRNSKVPVICDIDTGYGNPLNVMRTIQEFEQAGVSAVQMEDQVTPKRCGHTAGKQLISKGDMVKKIEAAIHARKNEAFALIARTDAIAVNGLEDALDRARAYAKAGADILFVEAPGSVDEMKQVVDTLGDVPQLANMVEGGGKTPILPVKELENIGFKIAIYPATPWMAAIKAMQTVLTELKEKGSTEAVRDRMVSFQEMFEIVGYSHFRELENRFSSK